MKKLKHLLTVLIVSSVGSHFASAQWVHQNSGTSDFLYDVFFPTKDTGYVNSINNELLLKTTNGGTTWNVIDSLTGIVSLYFTSKDTGYATTNTSIMKTTNGGNSWTTQYGNSNLDMGVIHFSDKNTGYTTGSSNNDDTLYFIKTINAGSSWNIVSWVTGSFIIPMISISFVSRDTGFFVGNTFQIYRTVDGCASVNSVFSSAALIESIHFPTKDTGYATGYPDAVIKTVNRGNTWNILPSLGNSEYYMDVFFTTKDTGFITASAGSLSYGKILYTANGGNTWTTQITDTSLNAIYFPSHTVGYAIGTNGTILKYNGVIGIDENENAQALLTTYPNPANKFVVISSEFGDKKTEIEIFDVLGNKVLNEQLSTNNYQLTIDVSSLSEGIYFLCIKNKEKVFSQKIIISR